MRLNSGLLLTFLGLCYSLCLRPDLDKFRERLQQYLPLPDGPTLPITGHKGVDAALEVLQIEREREKAVEVEKEGCNRVDSGIPGPSAADQDEEMVDVTDQPQTPVDEVDNALKILVRNATEEFGFIPRDVYQGVFDLPGAKRGHIFGMGKPDCSEIITMVREFRVSRGISSPASHRVVVVFPKKHTLGEENWEINFKSTRIAKRMVGLLLLEEGKHLRKTYDLLHKSSESSTFAGWFFEAIVHHKFSTGWEDESVEHISKTVFFEKWQSRSKCQKVSKLKLKTARQCKVPRKWPK